MKAWIYKKSVVIFWLTSFLYLITLFLASYVGVYLTYIAVPVIILTGCFAWFLKPNEHFNFKAEIEDELQIERISQLLEKKDSVNSLDIPVEDKLALKSTLDRKIKELAANSRKRS